MELRILIVDDEEIIREGIRFKVNYLLPGALIAGEAQDADEAMDMVKTCRPNVVITDICMPETDGIEFIRRAKAVNDRLKFVIISGYQDFGYARNAISLGVDEYLLKPIEDGQLQEILLKIQGELEEEVRKEAKISSLKSEIRTGRDSLKDKYFADIINHPEDVDVRQIVKNLEILDIRFTKPCFTVVNIMVSCCHNTSGFLLEKDLSILKYSIKNIAEEILAALGTVVAFESLKDDKQVIALINHESAVNSHKVNELCREIIHSLNKYLKLSLSIGIGNSFSHMQDMPNAYMEAYIAALQRIVLGSDRVIEFRQVPDSNRITFFLTDDYKMRLVNYVKEGNARRCCEIVDRIFGQIEAGKLPYKNIKVLYIDLLLLLSKTVKEAGGSWEKIFREDVFSEEYLLRCISLDSLKALVKSHVALICGYISGLAKSEGKKVIDEIKEYIDNYYYSEVNLTELAGKYYLNSNYLGQLFKTESGENFVDYLTRKRIEKSVDLLLNTEFHTYKVGEMVGYVNPKYFCDVFKKVVGMTPSQFRQQRVSEVS